MPREPEDAPAGYEHHAGERSVPELEVDQNVAPRPEEEIADALRTPTPPAESTQ